MRQLIHKENFKSHLFIKLFCSYVLIILSIFILFFCGIFFLTADQNRERQNQYYRIMVQELGTSLDVQIEEANVILASIKSSYSFKNFNMDRSSGSSLVSTSELIDQIRSDIFSTNNLNIYDAILWMENTKIIYNSTQVYSVDHVFSEEDLHKDSVSISSLNDIYGMKSPQTLLSKEWMVYSQECSNVFAKGRISILLDKKNIIDNMRQLIPNDTNVSLDINGIEMFLKGDINDSYSYNTISSADSSIVYTLHVDKSNYKNELSIYMIVAIGIALIAVIVFILLALCLANNYYEPVENIEKIIDDIVPGEKNTDEFSNITLGISRLIGERNGYREKMISIKPYAQQGVLHGLMNGNIEEEHINVLTEEDYMVLHKPYFMLGVVNIAYIGDGMPEKEDIKQNKWILQEGVSRLSKDDCNIVLYDKDINNTFIIVNSNSNEGLEEVFYKIHQKVREAVSKKGYVVTLGVDQIREDISQINDACNTAVKMLSNMMVGGRDAVYFYEKEIEADRHKYYFPKDAVNRLTNALREYNIQYIREYIHEILNTNTTKYDISPDTVELLIDELHISTIKVIKNVNQSGTIDFSIEKMQQEATLEEIFEYYIAIYQTVCDKVIKLNESRKEADELNRDILKYIDEKCFDSNISLQLLTEKFGVSNKYLSIMCKKYLGMTYLQYIQDKRIKQAVVLMETTNQSLENIANQIGYTSMLTFRRNFKAVMGVNPSEYSGKDINH